MDKGDLAGIGLQGKHGFAKHCSAERHAVQPPDQFAADPGLDTVGEPVAVQVAPCDQANAFYDPSEKMITMCSEMADYILTSLEANP